jgi:hypothetical protein
MNTVPFTVLLGQVGNKAGVISQRINRSMVQVRLMLVAPVVVVDGLTKQRPR